MVLRISGGRAIFLFNRKSRGGISRRDNCLNANSAEFSLLRNFPETRPPPFLCKLTEAIDPVVRTEAGHQPINAMNILSAFWLPKPATDVGEKPKTKPVQTEVETRLWKICPRKKMWLQALIDALSRGQMP